MYLTLDLTLETPRCLDVSSTSHPQVPPMTLSIMKMLSNNKLITRHTALKTQIVQSQFCDMGGHGTRDQRMVMVP
jgi:hypothetical protein